MDSDQKLSSQLGSHPTSVFRPFGHSMTETSKWWAIATSSQSSPGMTRLVSHINWGLAPPFECGGYWGSWVPLTKMSRRAHWELLGCFDSTKTRFAIVIMFSLFSFETFETFTSAFVYLYSVVVKVPWQQRQGWGLRAYDERHRWVLLKDDLLGGETSDSSWACQQAEEREGHHHMTWCTSAWFLKIW